MNILVPIDFDQAADNAKVFATEIAKLSSGKIIFLHAVPPIFNFASLEEESWVDSMRSAKRKMRNYVEELKNQGINSSYKVVEGNLWSGIESMLIPNAIDIIIMGTLGAKGIKKLLVGSNASSTLTSVIVPVLFIPLGASYNRLEKIVITLEDPQDAPGYVEEIIRLTGKWALPYEFFHISSADEAELEDFNVQHMEVIEKMFPATSFGLANRFAATVQEGLDTYQKEHPEAMFVMLSTHKNLFEKIFSRSETEQVVLHPEVPLLVIKEDFIK